MLVPLVAETHNRPVSLTRLLLHPSQPGRLIAVGTWGLALSEDDGANWHWLCAAAYDVDARFEDPSAALTADGSLFLATYLGLRRASTPVPCQFEAPSGRLGEGFVIDVTLASGGSRLFALLSDLNSDDVLYTSTDELGEFEERYRVFELLLDRVRVAPSDASVVYMSAGQVHFAGMPYRSFLLASEDGGRNFSRTEFALEEGETALLLTAVSPADPKRIFGEVIGFRGAEALERIVRSDDGGQTWRTVLGAPDARYIALSEDGQTVFVGSTLGGLWRSSDGGGSFELVQPDLHVRCLTWSGRSLYVCTDPSLDGFALGVSTDRGATVVPRLRLSEIIGIASCPSCSAGGFVCPAWDPDVVYDLRLDAALPENFDPDGGTGAPRDLGPSPPPCPNPDLGVGDITANGDTGSAITDASPVDEPVDQCGCRTSHSGPKPTLLLGLLLGLLLVRRLRPKRRV